MIRCVSDPATVLTAARLRLRPLERANSAAVFGLLSDPETLRFRDRAALTERVAVDERRDCDVWGRLR